MGRPFDLIFHVKLVQKLGLCVWACRLARPSWYTQNELAARLGTVADVVQRSLRRLEAEGVIRVERHLITILDPERLAELAE